MSYELKPCPFCQDGGDLFINGGVGCRWVECSSCGCEGPAYETEAEAVEAWNTRAERMTQNVTDAWNDWGVNVFDDDSLDDFGRFEKVYQICQEIVEPIE